MARIMTALRDLVPIRPLSLIEALRIAELQSQRLLKLTGIEAPPVPERVITDLPHIQVERIDLGDLSGAAQWAHGRWLILINRKDVAGRQRFSLCHEFKHVLDNPFADTLYSGCIPNKQRVEQVCDYFAGCVLMPRPWLKTAWASGMQDVRSLAKHFDVSLLAMRVRLLQVGIINNTPRWERAA